MVLSNVCVPDVLVLSSSLAIVFRAHVSLQGPLQVEFSSFSLTLEPSMKAQGGEDNSISKKQAMPLKRKQKRIKRFSFESTQSRCRPYLRSWH